VIRTGGGIAGTLADGRDHFAERMPMSSINGLGSNSPVQQTQNVAKAAAPAAADSSTPTRSADRLELSGVSHLFQSLKTNDVRAEKVAAIKAQIENGTYDVDNKKLDGALDGLLDDLTK
jgi:flagellar biosynthesis anti-sigma factor FlgM